MPSDKCLVKQKLAASLIAILLVASWVVLRRDRGVSDSRVQELCSRCHLFPPPDAQPRFAWRDTVADMYRLPAMKATVGTDPPQEAVAAWFEARAPERLDLFKGEPVDEGYAGRFARRGFAPKDAPPVPGAGNVK